MRLVPFLVAHLQGDFDVVREGKVQRQDDAGAAARCDRHAVGGDGLVGQVAQPKDFAVAPQKYMAGQEPIAKEGNGRARTGSNAYAPDLRQGSKGDLLAVDLGVKFPMVDLLFIVGRFPLGRSQAAPTDGQEGGEDEDNRKRAI